MESVRCLYAMRIFHHAYIRALRSNVIAVVVAFFRIRSYLDLIVFHRIYYYYFSFSCLPYLTIEIVSQM